MMNKTRIPLASNISRCRGCSVATLCATCARREQLQHDDPERWYPLMSLRPKDDGSCAFHVREDYR